MPDTGYDNAGSSRKPPSGGGRGLTVWLLGGFLLSVCAAAFLAYRQQMISTRDSALESAAMYSRAISEFRSLYTSEVVERLRPLGIGVSHDYQKRDGHIPLPATLSILLGERIGLETGGASVALFSPYPFPNRQHGGLRDDFGRAAWAAINAQPERPFFSIEESDGGWQLRYATADPLRPACVQCHNRHPESPKTDWRVGDVRGVLEVRYPVSAAAAGGLSFMNSTLMIIVILSGVTLAAIVLADRRLRQANALLEQRVRDRTAALEESQSLIRGVMESSVDAIVTIDEAGTIISFNRAAEDMFGRTAAETIGVNVTVLMPSPHHEQHDRYLKAYLAGGEPKIIGVGQRRLRGIRSDGSTFPLELGVSEVSTGPGRRFAGVMRDISQILANEEALERVSLEDALTGLANRRAFDRVLAAEWARSRRAATPVSSLLIDVDHFKLYNDALGHTAGDECLKQVASILSLNLPRETDFVARYGGEEFVVLLSMTHLDGARCVGERLREAVEAAALAHPSSPVSDFVTISVGVTTVIPRHGQAARDLVARADEALYVAKECRNCVHGFPGSLQEPVAR